VPQQARSGGQNRPPAQMRRVSEGQGFASAAVPVHIWNS
jgi:hypothetical protein